MTRVPSAGAAPTGAATVRSARRARAKRAARARALGAGERIDVLDAFRQAMLAPRAPAVLGAEHLARAADAVDAVGVGRVQRDGHHRRFRLDAVVEALPRLADVVAAVERAVLAAGGGAEARVQDTRVLRADADVAAVRQRREAAHLHVAPARAAIGALEQPHADGGVGYARVRGREGNGVDVQHALDLGVAHDTALVVRQVGELDEVRGAVGPRLAAVVGLHDAADLEPGPDRLRPRRIRGQPHDAAREPHLHALGQDRLRQPPPRVTAVVTAKHADRRGPGIDPARIARMHENRPDLQPALGQGQPLPGFTAVLAPVRPIVGADIDDVWI